MTPLPRGLNERGTQRSFNFCEEATIKFRRLRAVGIDLDHGAMKTMCGASLDEVHAADQAQRELIGASANEVTDRKDEVTQRQLSDLGGAQEQRNLDEMARVEVVLQHLDAETYGACADCGEPVALQRLQARPAAQRCALCLHARYALRFTSVCSLAHTTQLRRVIKKASLRPPANVRAVLNGSVA